VHRLNLQSAEEFQSNRLHWILVWGICCLFDSVEHDRIIYKASYSKTWRCGEN